MQPQDPRDPYGSPQAYPPQGQNQPQGIPQPQMPGQPSNTPGFNQQAQQPYMPPMPAYQVPVQRNSGPVGSQSPDMSPAPAPAATPYDFFMQPKQQAPSRPLPMGGKLLGNRPVNPNSLSNGGNPGSRKFIFIIAGAISLVVILLLAVVLFSPKDQTGPQFFGIAQTQQELIRVCGQGSEKAKYQATRNLAATCSVGITNSQGQLLAYMKKAKLSYDTKLIGGKASSQTDAKLAQAISSSTFDDTFREIIQAQLASYNRALTAQLATTTGANGREVLTKNQKSAELLTLMAADNSDKTEAITTNQ